MSCGHHRSDEDRLWQSLMDMGEVGALPHGGCCRAALGVDDSAGRDLFVRWCREAGCDVQFDQVGNIYARRPGRDPRRKRSPPAATWTRSRTAASSMASMACWPVSRSCVRSTMRTSRRSADRRDRLDQRGGRAFQPAAGRLVGVRRHCRRGDDPCGAHARWHDRARGSRVAGYLGSERPGARALDCFVEAHIEQGPILEAEGRTIGVVTKIQGIRWLRVTVTGHGRARRHDADEPAPRCVAGRSGDDHHAQRHRARASTSSRV